MNNRSFARRVCRSLSATSKELLEKFLPQFEVNLANPYELIIPKSSEIFLEIGFGMGDNIVKMALANPDQYFIGAEPYKNGIVRVLRNIKEHNLKNLLIWPDDVSLLLPNLPDDSLSGVYVLFPDPWPKKRHQKRRLVSESFICTLSQKLASKGQLYFASDVKDYADQVLQLLLRCKELRTSDSKALDENNCYTKYHSKALEKNLETVTFLQFQKL
jgi:release factor glutamine methyltransferase